MIVYWRKHGFDYSTGLPTMEMNLTVFFNFPIVYFYGNL